VIFVDVHFFLALMFMATIGVMLAFIAGRYVR
jgi:hypothetical protein